jgi:hypothetical protein
MFYTFNNKKLGLKNYRNFVMLELIDRLLKIGYEIDSISIINEINLNIIKDNEIFIKVYLREYGIDYDELINEYEYKENEIVVLYTSQLSGGLIDFKTKIYNNGNNYSKGIFERNSKPYKFKLGNDDNSKIYPEEFKIKDNVLLKYFGKEKEVIIPSGIRQIGSGAFWNNMFIEKVIIPNTVTSIHGDAFVYCENLKEITITEKITEIGDNPFAGCINLTLQNNSKEFVLIDGVLFDKKKKILIHYSSNKTNEIYSIPSTVTWLGKHSFYKCVNLKKVTITKNVDFIGNNAFSDCCQLILKNKSKHFIYNQNVLYNDSGTNVIHFSMGSKRKTVKLLNTVRTIGRNSFWNCTNLKKLYIPESVRQIGYNPFAKCKNLTFINFSNHYAVINKVLYDSSIKEVVCGTSKSTKNGIIKLPKSVISIGRNAFTGCDSLVEIIIPNTLELISRGAFSDCINLEKIIIPATIKDIGDWAFNNCVSLKQIELPKELSIKPNTFTGCKAIIIKY